MELLFILAAALVGAAVLVVISRANEIFYVSVRDGRCLVVRGRVAPSLWSELQAIARMSGARRGSIRAYKDRGSARVVASGLGEGFEQRIRNALGARGFHRATASGASAPCASASCGSRNLGQLLGIAWLAWLFSQRGP